MSSDKQIAIMKDQVQTIENDLSQKQNALAISSNDLANKLVEI